MKRVFVLTIFFLANHLVFGQPDSLNEDASFWYKHQLNLFDDLRNFGARQVETDNFMVIKTYSYKDTTRIGVAFLDSEHLNTMLYQMTEDRILGYCWYKNAVVLIVGKDSSAKFYKKIFPIVDLEAYRAALDKLAEPADSTVLKGIRIWQLISIHQLIFVNCIYNDQVVKKYVVQNSRIYD
jgi:hypothetical protein